MMGALDGDYVSEWRPAANALLDQIVIFQTARDAVPDDSGQFQTRFRNYTGLIVIELVGGLTSYDEGRQQRDAALLQTGTDYLSDAAENIDAVNDLLAEWTPDCP